MALATNTTLGTIVLAGDFYGNDPAAPILTPSGVTPTTTANFYTQVIDAKGRTVHTSDYSTPADKDEINSLLGNWNIATKFVKGFVQVGDNINVTGGVISLPVASSSVFGVVKAGSGLEIDGNEDLNVVDASKTAKGLFQLSDGFTISAGILSSDVATTISKGIVQVGSGLSVTGGTLSFSSSAASTSTKGSVQLGTNFTISNGIISTPEATNVSKGVIQIGDGLTVTSGIVSAPDAYVSSKGIIQPGSGLSISSGTISANTATPSVKGIVQPGTYFDLTGDTLNCNLEIATASTLGKIIVGEGLSVDGTGTISISNASTTTKGIAQIGSNISVSSGIISMPQASTSVFGVSYPGTGLSLISDALTLSYGTATDTVLGLVNAGFLSQTGSTGIYLSSGSLTVGMATASEFGIVKPGTGLSISAGVLSLTPPGDATNAAKGIVQPGSNVNITNGIISVDAVASDVSLGLARLDNTVNKSFGIVTPIHPNDLTIGNNQFQPTASYTITSATNLATTLYSTPAAVTVNFDAASMAQNMVSSQIKPIKLSCSNLSTSVAATITLGSGVVFNKTRVNAGTSPTLSLAGPSYSWATQLMLFKFNVGMGEKVVLLDMTDIRTKFFGYFF